MPRKRKQTTGRVIDNGAADDDDGVEEEYEVEEILDHRSCDRDGTAYLLKWKGYSVDESTWEHESNLSCPDVLLAYKAKLGSRAENGEGDGVNKADSECSAFDPFSPPSVRPSEQLNGENGADGQDPGDADLPDVVSREAYGWDRGLTPRKVLGVTRNPDNSLWVLVAWRESDHLPDLVPSNVVNRRIPHLMIEYYEKHLRWKQFQTGGVN